MTDSFQHKQDIFLTNIKKTRTFNKLYLYSKLTRHSGLKNIIFKKLRKIDNEKERGRGKLKETDQITEKRSKGKTGTKTRRRKLQSILYMKNRFADFLKYLMNSENPQNGNIFYHTPLFTVFYLPLFTLYIYIRTKQKSEKACVIRELRKRKTVKKQKDS